MAISAEKRQEYNRQYYQANRDSERKRKLEHYHANKGKLDREKIKAYNKQYREAHERKPRTPEQAEERNRPRRERYANDPEYREKAKATARERNKRLVGVKKNGRLKAEFGITLNDYNAILERQGGGCAICGAKRTGVREAGKAEHALYVDHDHVTGKVRGLLCNRCNFGLGQFRDDPDLLQKAIGYLNTTAQADAALSSQAADAAPTD